MTNFQMDLRKGCKKGCDILQEMSGHTGSQTLPPEEKKREENPVNPCKDRSGCALIEMPQAEGYRSDKDCEPPVLQVKIESGKNKTPECTFLCQRGAHCHNYPDKFLEGGSRKKLQYIWRGR